MNRVQWSRLRDRKRGKCFAKLLATLIRMSLTGQVYAYTLEGYRIYIDSDSAWWHVGLHVKKWCILNCKNTVTGNKYWSVCRPVTVHWWVQWPLCCLQTSGDGTHEVQLFVKETDRGERKHPHLNCCLLFVRKFVIYWQVKAGTVSWVNLDVLYLAIIILNTCLIILCPFQHRLLWPREHGIMSCP